MKLVKEYINEAEEFKYIKPKSIEQIKKALEGKSLKEKFVLSIENNIPWLLQDCIDKGIDTSQSDYKNHRVKNWAIAASTFDNYTEIIKLLLKDKNVDPSMIGENIPLTNAIRNKNDEIIKLLLKDKRVLNTISESDLYKYKKYLEK
jgi:hypothetical protein